MGMMQFIRYQPPVLTLPQSSALDFSEPIYGLVTFLNTKGNPGDWSGKVSVSSLSSVTWTHAQIAPLCACPNLSNTVNMADADA